MFQTEIILFYSSKGNNQFVKMPYKVPREGTCNIVDGAWTNYGIAKDLAVVSTFPAPVPNESLCAKYTAVKQIALNNKKNPKFAAQSTFLGKLYSPRLYCSKGYSSEVYAARIL